MEAYTLASLAATGGPTGHARLRQVMVNRVGPRDADGR